MGVQPFKNFFFFFNFEMLDYKSYKRIIYLYLSIYHITKLQWYCNETVKVTWFVDNSVISCSFSNNQIFVSWTKIHFDPLLLDCYILIGRFLIKILTWFITSLIKGFKGILNLVLTYIFSTRDEGCFFSI
jgi:hypothetical protein